MTVPIPSTRFEKEMGAPASGTARPAARAAARGRDVEGASAPTRTRTSSAQRSRRARSSGGAPEFWAEDLVRGFRFDVWDGNSPLALAVRREAVYSMDAGALTVSPKGGEEEAIVRLGATTSPIPQATPIIREPS